MYDNLFCRDITMSSQKTQERPLDLPDAKRNVAITKRDTTFNQQSGRQDDQFSDESTPKLIKRNRKSRDDAANRQRDATDYEIRHHCQGLIVILVSSSTITLLSGAFDPILSAVGV